MRISHPIAPYQGFQPEDVFFVSDDRMTQLGTGYIIRFEQPSLYPERPLHYFISIEAEPQARNMLFGALMARAEQLHAQTPNVPARLYACVPAGNTDMVRFYEECGLVTDDAEDVVRFDPMTGEQRAPMGLTCEPIPLNNVSDRMNLLQRINYNCIQPFDPDHLVIWEQQPQFCALAFKRNGLPVTEAIFAGTEQSVTLIHIYTLRDYRRQHLARQLLGVACSYLASRGVVAVYAHVYRRNLPQTSLMEKLNATYVRTETMMPGLNL